MPQRRTCRTLHRLAGLPLCLLAIVYSGSAGAVAIEPDFLRVDLPTNDLVYSTRTGLVYASIPSRAGTSLGDRIAAIDPRSGAIVSSTWVGSEPGALALADDGRTLWIGLDGTDAVRRFDVVSMTAGDSIPLNGIGLRTGYSSARPVDIAVAPGRPDRIAVARRRSGHYGSTWMELFEDGDFLGRADGHVEQLTFGDDDESLFGWGDDQLQRMIVGTSGVEVVETARGLQSNRDGHILHADGVLYGADGSALSADDWSRLGRYAASGDVALQSESGLVFILSDWCGRVDELHAFDLESFVAVATFDIVGGRGGGEDLIAWGSSGLAFRTTGDQVYLVSSVPQPDTATLLAIGLLGLGFNGRAPRGSPARARAGGPRGRRNARWDG